MLRARSYPLEPITQAASAEALRAWLMYPEYSDEEISVANMVLTEATELLVDYMQREIKPRRRRLEVPDWPRPGTRVGGVVPIVPDPSLYLPLPYGPVISVQSVTADGDTVDAEDYELVGDRLDMSPTNDLVVDYTAGYDGDTFIEPSQIKRAVLTLAAWIWHHRGDESSDSPIQASGAAGIIRSLVRYAA